MQEAQVTFGTFLAVEIADESLDDSAVDGRVSSLNIMLCRPSALIVINDTQPQNQAPRLTVKTSHPAPRQQSDRRHPLDTIKWRPDRTT